MDQSSEWTKNTIDLIVNRMKGRDKSCENICPFSFRDESKLIVLVQLMYKRTNQQKTDKYYRLEKGHCAKSPYPPGN